MKKILLIILPVLFISGCFSQVSDNVVVQNQTSNSIPSTGAPSQQPDQSAQTPPPLPNGSFTMDTSDIISRESGEPVRGTLIISHNAFALFPLDLTTEYRKLDERGPDTIIELQVKEGCWADKNLSSIYDTLNSSLSRGFEKISTKNTTSIKNMYLEMPYKVSQDNYTRIPDTFCFGFHIENGGWELNLTPIMPVFDDSQDTAFAQVSVNKTNVDAIAILFDSTTAINKITFEAAKE